MFFIHCFLKICKLALRLETFQSVSKLFRVSFREKWVCSFALLVFRCFVHFRGSHFCEVQWWGHFLNDSFCSSLLVFGSFFIRFLKYFWACYLVNGVRINFKLSLLLWNSWHKVSLVQFTSLLEVHYQVFEIITPTFLKHSCSASLWWLPKLSLRSF